jgi:hypothetical protein
MLGSTKLKYLKHCDCKRCKASRLPLRRFRDAANRKLRRQPVTTDEPLRLQSVPRA